MKSAHGNVEKYSLTWSCPNNYNREHGMRLFLGGGRTTFGMSNISINTREIIVKERRDKSLISAPREDEDWTESFALLFFIEKS